ncbi:MAG: helix-turn-helix transcriptional regulator [Erythrobacter sp.]
MSTRPPSDTHRGGRRTAVVAAIVVLQAVGATFFITDAVIDLSTGGWGVHIITEMVIALALVAGVALGAWQMRQMIEQARRDAATLTLARGAFAEIIAARFGQWGLTAAESEVALFALKGCDTAEIASLRGVAEGTVRAQLTAIYSKAGVSSRHALASLFLDDLIAGPVAGTGAGSSD